MRHPERDLRDRAAGQRVGPSFGVAELGEKGVQRVSSGSLPYRAAVDAAVNAVNDLRDGKQAPAATPYWEMQSRLVAFRQDRTD